MAVLYAMDDALEALLIKLLEDTLPAALEAACERRNAVTPGKYDDHEIRMLLGMLKLGLNGMVGDFKKDAHKLVGKYILEAYMHQRYPERVSVPQDIPTKVPTMPMLPAPEMKRSLSGTMKKPGG